MLPIIAASNCAFEPARLTVSSFRNYLQRTDKIIKYEILKLSKEEQVHL
jgi:hypothetical protein